MLVTIPMQRVHSSNIDDAYAQCPNCGGSLSEVERLSQQKPHPVHEIHSLEKSFKQETIFRLLTCYQCAQPYGGELLFMMIDARRLM